MSLVVQELTAIAFFFKCYQRSAARSKLNPTDIFAGDQMGLEIFEYFKTLRDKHYLHDENGISQCIPGAVLNKEGAEYKIAKIVSIIMTGMFLWRMNIATYCNFAPFPEIG